MAAVLLLLVLLSTILSTLPATGIGAPLLRPPSARAVPITEGTEPPENPPDNYSPCGGTVLTKFYYDIYAENNECRSKTTYNWDATDGKIPSTAAREEVCSCKRLIQKLQTVQVPHCTRLVNKVWCPYARLLEYTFGLCNVGSSTTPQVTEWPVECSGTAEPTNPIKTSTPSPVKTTATPSPVRSATPSPVKTETPEPSDPVETAAPSASGSFDLEPTDAPETDPPETDTPSPTDPIETDSPSPTETTMPTPFVRTRTPSPTFVSETSSNTAAIAGGSVASVASIGIVITITLRCRRKRHEKKHEKHHKADVEFEGVDVSDAAALAGQLLSPLEDSPSSTGYAEAQG